MARRSCLRDPQGQSVLEDPRQNKALLHPVLSVGSQLVSTWQSSPSPAQASGREVLPLGQGGRAAGFVGLAIDEVAFRIEFIAQGGMNRGEFL